MHPGTLEYSEDLGTKSFAKGGRDKYNKKDKTTEKNPPKKTNKENSSNSSKQQTTRSNKRSKSKDQSFLSESD